jgi:hypothetical protein
MVICFLFKTAILIYCFYKLLSICIFLNFNALFNVTYFVIFNIQFGLKNRLC